MPSQTEVNPKEYCKVVTLRSGKQLGQVSGETMVIDEDAEDLAQTSIQIPPVESYIPPKSYVPPILFPQRLKQNRIDHQF